MRQIVIVYVQLRMGLERLLPHKQSDRNTDTNADTNTDAQTETDTHF